MRKLNQLSLFSLLAFTVAVSPAGAQDQQGVKQASGAAAGDPQSGSTKAGNAQSGSTKPGNAKAGAPANQSQLERGKYIVENVAMCELCHTPRTESGNPDKGHWLMGGPAQLRPSYYSPYWALIEPRLAGRPPGTDADFIKLLTTGISRTGHPPNPPMPPFRMTQPDAEAVLAYLKSLPR